MSGAGFLLRFRGDVCAAGFASQTANLEDAGGFSSGRVDVQGGCGVHVMPRSVVESEKKITQKVNIGKKKTRLVIFSPKNRLTRNCRKANVAKSPSWCLEACTSCGIVCTYV